MILSCVRVQLLAMAFSKPAMVAARSMVVFMYASTHLYSGAKHSSTKAREAAMSRPLYSSTYLRILLTFKAASGESCCSCCRVMIKGSVSSPRGCSLSLQREQMQEQMAAQMAYQQALVALLSSLTIGFRSSTISMWVFTKWQFGQIPVPTPVRPQLTHLPIEITNKRRKERKKEKGD